MIVRRAELELRGFRGVLTAGFFSPFSPVPPSHPPSLSSSLLSLSETRTLCVVSSSLWTGIVELRNPEIMRSTGWEARGRGGDETATLCDAWPASCRLGYRLTSAFDNMWLCDTTLVL